MILTLNMKLLRFCYIAATLLSSSILISSARMKSTFSLSTKHFLKKIDPDYNRTLIEILTSRGYKVETHFATTSDGYILRLFRIPSAKNSTVINKRPCLLMHGILDSADSFVLHYEDKAHPYVLVNSGYDVWLGNNRGNKYSRNHTRLDPDKDENYWEFTYSEMGKYDLPAMIDYILNYTNKTNLTYIGHSQGTIQMFAASSEDPDYFSKKVNGVIGLGPATKLGNLSSSFGRFLAKAHIDSMLAFLNIHEFLPNSKAFHKFTAFVCEKLLFLCDGMVGMVADTNPDDNDQVKLPVYITHYPAGSSLKSFSHLLQSVRDGTFSKYDYGKKKNIEVYGQVSPPQYNVTNIKGMKFCLFVGKDDPLATVEDGRVLRDQLKAGGNLLLYKEVDAMGHITFFIPKNIDYFKDIEYCLSIFNKN